MANTQIRHASASVDYRRHVVIINNSVDLAAGLENAGFMNFETTTQSPTSASPTIAIQKSNSIFAIPNPKWLYWLGLFVAVNMYKMRQKLFPVLMLILH